jgi:hypothetical protein
MGRMNGATAEYQTALDANADTWVPASGGHETPFRDRLGRTVIYMWNPQTREHAYYDASTDTFLAFDYDPQRGF